MKKIMDTIARIMLLSTIAIMIVSCGNGSGYSNTSQDIPIQDIPIENCYIHLENGDVIKMNPDRTAQLMERGETYYGSWEDWSPVADIEVEFKIPGHRYPMKLYLGYDDYVYFDYWDAKAKNPNSQRLHYSKSLNN